MIGRHAVRGDILVVVAAILALVLVIGRSNEVSAAPSRCGIQHGSTNLQEVDRIFDVLRDGVPSEELEFAIQTFKDSQYYNSDPIFLELAYQEAFLSLQPDAMELVRNAGARLTWNNPITGPEGRVQIDWQNVLLQQFEGLEFRCRLSSLFFGRESQGQAAILNLNGKDVMDPANYSPGLVQRSKDAQAERREIYALRARTIAVFLEHMGVTFATPISDSAITGLQVPKTLAGLAVRHRDPGLVSEILKRGFSLFSDQEEAAKMLLGAISQFDIESVTILLGVGADPQHKVTIDPRYLSGIFPLQAPRQPPGSVVGLPPMSALDLIDQIRNLEKNQKLQAFLFQGKNILASNKSINWMRMLLTGEVDVDITTYVPANLSTAERAKRSCAEKSEHDDRRGELARLRECLYTIDTLPEFILRDRLLDLTVERPAEFVERAKAASKITSLSKMNFSIDGSWQAVRLGRINPVSGTDFSNTTILNERENRGEETWVAVNLKRASTESFEPNTIAIKKDTLMSGRGGNHDRSGLKSDEHDTASVDFTITGDLTISGCGISGLGSDPPCLPMVHVYLLNPWATSNEAGFVVKQNTRTIDLFKQGSAYFDRTKGPIMLSFRERNWFRQVGVHDPVGFRSHFEARITLANQLVGRRPRVDNIYTAAAYMARHIDVPGIKLADTTTSGLGRTCAGPYMGNTTPQFSRRFKGLYLCLYTINKALSHYRHVITSSEVAELQVARHYLSSIARIQFQELVEQRAREIKKFLSDADLMIANEQMLQAIENRAKRADNMVALLAKLGLVKDVPHEVKDLMLKFIAEFNLAGDDTQKVYDAFRRQHLNTIKTEIQRQARYVLELQQYKRLDGLDDDQ